jgi:hypothetical protein
VEIREAGGRESEVGGENFKAGRKKCWQQTKSRRRTEMKEVGGGKVWERKKCVREEEWERESRKVLGQLYLGRLGPLGPCVLGNNFGPPSRAHCSRWSRPKQEAST